MGFIIELGFDGMAWATHPMRRAIIAFGIRVSTLNHEPGYDPMKSSAIVKIAICQILKVFNMPGSDIFQKLKLYIPKRCFYYCGLIRHSNS
jgi:hypothetical protein